MPSVSPLCLAWYNMAQLDEDRKVSSSFCTRNPWQDDQGWNIGNFDHLHKCWSCWWSSLLLEATFPLSPDEKVAWHYKVTEDKTHRVQRWGQCSMQVLQVSLLCGRWQRTPRMWSFFSKWEIRKKNSLMYGIHDRCTKCYRTFRSLARVTSGAVVQISPWAHRDHKSRSEFARANFGVQ